jgi:hypothetical protein
LYGQYFNEFLRVNKLDLSAYDAVIAPQYVRGGKQLCILSHNGRGAKLQAGGRAMLRPDRKSLLKERATLWEWVDHTFGTTGKFQPDPKLWTDEGFKRITGGR